MPNATVRANARTLPEATPYPDAEIQALAAEFEAAWAAEGVIFKSSSTDAEANAAAARVDEIAQKIVAIPTTDIEMMRVKARIYLWSEGTDFKAFAAENEGKGWSESVLASLFRDLGVGGPIEASPDEETMTITSVAAMDFDPISAADVDALRLQAEVGWRDHLFSIKQALAVLRMTKDELKKGLRRAKRNLKLSMPKIGILSAALMLPPSFCRCGWKLWIKPSGAPRSPAPR
jgi:hypothetical protein